MRDDEIDAILGAAPGVDPALIDRIAGRMTASLKPVRPLPSMGALVAALVAVCAAVAVTGGVGLGAHGFVAMDALERIAIFAALAALMWFSARVYAGAMIPGSPHSVTAWSLGALIPALLVALFAALFHDYHTARFVAQGWICLRAGLIHAIPAGIGAWFILRRGFAVNPVAAGAARGIFAALAGVAMLEIHCNNFEAPHVMLWHTAVVPVSGAVSALIALRTKARSSLPSPSAGQ